MSYAVKEMFLTLQGEGVQAGRRAVFIRFAGCNLWTGREQDRATAVCQFCDTDFVGMDGTFGGRYEADQLASQAEALWDGPDDRRFAVLTGGEPMLQVDAPLLAALKARGFEVAAESNGTIAAPAGIDWLCISPKAGSDVVQRAGQELKVVWPQAGLDLDELAGWDFPNRLIQPLDDENHAANTAAAISAVMRDPRWRLTIQAHKHLGLR